MRGAPTGAAAELIDWANRSPAPVLALDVPSGVDATTGEAPGVYVQATWTLTLALPKTGLVPERTGELYLGDLGIPEAVYRRLGLPYTCPFGNRFWVRLRADEKAA